MLLTEEVFATEYAKYFARTARGVGARFHLSWELSEDIAQAAWVRAWEKRAQYEGRCSVSTWVTVIANRIWYTFLRRSRGREFERLEGCGPSVHGRFYESDIEDRLDCEVLRAFLSPAQAEIAGLRWEMGYSIAETVRLTHRPSGSIKSQLHRGVETMRAVALAPPKRFVAGAAR